MRRASALLSLLALAPSLGAQCENDRLRPDDAAANDAFGSAVALGAQCENDRLRPDDAAANDAFGSAVALDGDRALVGAPAEGTAAAGAAYLFERAGEGWVQAQRFDPPDPDFNDQFGFAVSLDGDVVAVGAPRSDEVLSNDGAVFVLRLVDGEWTPEAVLRATEPTVDAHFGHAVAVDGTSILVGAPQHTLDTGGPFESRHGLVYLFRYNGAAWIQDVVFRAPTPQDNGVFGASVALEGPHALVGSSHPQWIGMETVFAYEFAGGEWDALAAIPSQAPAGARFGYSIGLEGERVVVGAPDAPAPGGDAVGAAYVLSTPGGGSVVLEATLQPPALADGDGFGRAVALAAGRALVGAPDHVPAAGASGLAFLFEEDGGTWSATATLGPSDASAVSQFGASLALDAERAWVGAASGASPAGSGAAYDFQVLAADCLLTSDTKSLSLAAGGAQTLALAAGDTFADATYFVLGTLTGTTPGLPFGGGIVLPLNFDDYTTVTLLSANLPPLVDTFGLLDAAGAATASIDLPPGFLPGLAGLQLHHAFVVLEAGTNDVLAASNPRVLDLLP